MNPRTTVLLATSAILALLVGCVSNQNSARKSDVAMTFVATSMALTGTEGAPFTGHYIVKGEKVRVSGVLPKTFSDFGVTGCEFRKVNRQDTLALLARDGSSVINFTVPPGAIGIKAKLVGGWNVGTITE